MRRRRYLGLTAAATTAGLAGCSGFLGDEAPDEVVEQFYQAIDEGDRETANGLIHPDSPTGEITEEEMSGLEDVDITVEGAEIVDESEDEAVVEAEVTWDDGEMSTTDTATIELRTDDGDWKVYE